MIVDEEGHPSCMQWKAKREFRYSNDDLLGFNGASTFVKINELETSKHLKDDCFIMKCDVSFVKPSCYEVRMANPVVVLPRNLRKQLCELLVRGDGTDIAFDVGGKTFHAHKCVLAARSPVFRAEFFGLMKESKQQAIKIPDIEVPIFEALLRFKYSDSLIELKETTESGDTANMAQHLLLAANRYGVERLKTFCESKLHENMEVHNVATTLALAEQHNCSQLKEAWLNFISPPEMLAAVVQTDGFKYLIRNCPLILKELYEKSGDDDMQ